MIRDVALACSLMTGVAALSLEQFHVGGMEYWPMAARIMGDEWIIMNGTWRLVYGSVMVLPHAVMQATLLLMVSRLVSVQEWRTCINTPTHPNSVGRAGSSEGSFQSWISCSDLIP